MRNQHDEFFESFCSHGENPEIQPLLQEQKIQISEVVSTHNYLFQPVQTECDFV